MNRSIIPWLLLATVSISFLIFGKHFGGRQGLLLGFIFALITNSLVYFYGDIRIKKLFRSKRVEGQDPYKLLEITDELCKKLHMQPPEILICDINTPTSYSVGGASSRAAIVLSQKLLNSLEKDELRAVIAFELIKIKSQHSFTAGLCSAIAAGTLKPAEWLDKTLFFGKNFKEELGPLTGLLSPLVSRLIKSIQTKSGIFELDKKTAELTGEAKALAQSIWKLDSLGSTQPVLVPKDTVHLFFTNPLPNYEWAEMFETKPNARSRIENLLGQYPI